MEIISDYNRAINRRRDKESLCGIFFLTSVVTADYTYSQIFRIHNNTDRKDNRNMQTNNESKQNQKKR